MMKSMSFQVSKGVEASLVQLLETGFLHADPHPGNLRYMTTGQIGYAWKMYQETYSISFTVINFVHKLSFCYNMPGFLILVSCVKWKGNISWQCLLLLYIL